MPLYMDIHDVPGATPEDLAKAHEADLKIQHEHGVNYLKYWFNQDKGKVFCLFDAPNADAANEVHRRSHGLMAERIIEVDPEVADGLLGRGEIDEAGAVLMPGKVRERDTAMRSILFTDIVGSTEITQQIGDAAAFALLEIHDGIVRAKIALQDGRVVKHTGDGFMACFDSACAAVECASMIQRCLRNEVDEDGIPRVQVRIGVAAGEPIERGDDLFGAAVQLAARLCAHADPGTILVSQAISELCLGKKIRFGVAENTALKGFDRSILACRVEIPA